jgi:hypothetical protein
MLLREHNTDSTAVGGVTVSGFTLTVTGVGWLVSTVTSPLLKDRSTAAYTFLMATCTVTEEKHICTSLCEHTGPAWAFYSLDSSRFQTLRYTALHDPTICS